MQIVKKVVCLFLVILAVHFSFGVDQNPATNASNNADTLADNNAAFAFDLYQKLNTLNKVPAETLCFSPYSTSTVLAMAYAGAREQTALEMAKVLHFSLEQGPLHTEFFNLASKLKESCNITDVQLSIANSLWPQSGYPLAEEYVHLLKEKYGSLVTPVNYIADPEKSRWQINAWVEKETQNKIIDLLQYGTITPSTRLVLVNAIYFKGNWDQPFSPEETREEKFYTSSEKSVPVPLMFRSANFNYAQFPTFSLLELPYKGYAFSLFVLLPNAIDGLTELENLACSKNLKEWANTLQSCKVNVYLPRFKVAANFSLSKTLKSMGMVAPFGPSANFSGMGGKPGDLYISDVIHKAILEVNEQGSEATAATATTMCMMSLQNLPKGFRADHPFLFILHENTTGTILFMGKLVNPSSE